MLMAHLALFAVLLLISSINSQQIGNYVQEKHPPLVMETCTVSGGCIPEQKSVVLDSNWRWVHKVGDWHNCYTDTSWDKNVCPDGPTCAKNCALDGVDYVNTYGIHTNNDSLKLDYVTGGNVGSRVYLMDTETEYYLFKLKNKEFTFDVDVSKLPCGLNGALYMVAMDGDGGTSKYPSNKAGAKYGTGYCDAQCPRDIKFINGEANCEDWSEKEAIGKYGTCCMEMDVWEANSISTAYTGHVCTTDGQYRCDSETGDECGEKDRYGGVCDRDGCDFNPYRCGDKTFFGPDSSFALDTSQVFTVVTQYITNDGTDTGDLKEIKRVWVQHGKVIQTRTVTVGGKYFNTLNDSFCNTQKSVFGDFNDYEKKGGNKRMGDAMVTGMVLTMSLWDDGAAHMLWLDSDFPVEKPVTDPGVSRGTCSKDSGVPEELRKDYPHAYVVFSNIRFGEIDSTYKSK